MQPVRLSGEPLRPRIVFERLPEVTTPKQSIGQPGTVVGTPETKAEAALKSVQPEIPAQKSTSKASEWSAKRLKKIETGAPLTVPGDSGPEMPISRYPGFRASQDGEANCRLDGRACLAIIEAAQDGEDCFIRFTAESEGSEAPAKKAGADLQPKVEIKAGPKAETKPTAKVDAKPIEQSRAAQRP